MLVRFGVLWLLIAFLATDLRGEDWPMGGKSPSRNPVSLEKNPPLNWDFPSKKVPARNVRWSARTGGNGAGGPVVAGGLVWIGTSNGDPLDPAVTGDRGVLACCRESDGNFLYQYTAERLTGMRRDWPLNGLSTSPVIEGDKLWFISNRREVICLNISPLRSGTGKPEVLWKYDLIAEHSVHPDSPMLHGPNTTGDLAIHRHLLFVPTGNGVATDHPAAMKVRMPKAPAIVCLNKETGEYVWEDHSAGAAGHGGSYASPLVVQTGDQVQVIHPQLDGWVRSYKAETGELLWKFDVNPKEAEWNFHTNTDEHRRTVVATPVFAEGRVYFATGREPEFCDGPGRLFCIDPSKSGDISPVLETAEGKSKPNPHSGLVWRFTKSKNNPEHEMHKTISSVAVHRGLVIAVDRAGFVHCVAAKTGEHYWSYDQLAGQYGNPLIVDDKVYVADEDGDVSIFALSKKFELLAEHSVNQAIESPPVFANGVLYVQTRRTLYAVRQEK